jgi:hydroxymethylglutaryl-CoA lyase
MSIPVDVKVSLIERLAEAGMSTIEAGSFVNPQWVPQMAGSDEVFHALSRREGVRYTALTPNLVGLERAIDCGVNEVAIFGAASEAFSQKNINCSIAESLQRFEKVMQRAEQAGLRVRGYVSCVLGCPYEGDIDPRVVARVASELKSMGCYEVSLGDTVGVGSPKSVNALLDAVLAHVQAEHLAVHFHDTYGQALVNIYAALLRGVAVVDSSVSGLGGCPYAKGAAGNVATEDVVYLLNGLGIQHGVDMQALLAAGTMINHYLGRQPVSKVARALSQ